MSLFNTELTKGDVAYTGIRGLQNMRRSRSTSSLGKTQGKVRTAREYLTKQSCATDNTITAKFVKCAVGSLGLDLMLPPLSGDKKADLHLLHKPAAKVVNKPCTNLPSNSPPQCAGTVRTEKAKTEADKDQSWTPVPSFPGHVESTSFAWRSFCKTIHSYEELYVLNAGDMEQDSKYDITSLCRHYYANAIQFSPPQRYYYANAIQFYEELYLLAGSDEASFDDEKLAKKCTNNLNVADRLCRFLFCREIHSYEEYYCLAGETALEFDDVYFDSLEVDEADKTNDGNCRHFFGRPIHSYEEFYNLVGTDDVPFDDDWESAKVSGCERHSFYCKEIFSYEEFYLLGGGDGEWLDGASRESTKAEQTQAFSFYCRSIQSYEDFYTIVGDAVEDFDDERSI